MKIFPALTLLLSLSSQASFSHTQAPGKPSLTMKCFNPDLSVRFTSIQRSQASTEPVQFNVNILAGKRTIFVDKNNHGICSATISDGYQFADGSGQIDPTQISVSEPGTASALMNDVIVIPRIQGNQTMMFEIVSRNNDIRGNLNISFIAKYKAD